MIEKLKEHDVIDPKTDKVIGKIGCDLREIMDKLNELVDAVNELQKNATHSKTEKVETPADPYAEQRKWIGKLCKFWDYDDEEKWFSKLEQIDKNSPYPYCASGDWWYKHCEPVEPDDDIIYKGEQ